MKRLYIKQKFLKITDHYPILDEEQNPVYYVNQDFTWVGLNVHVSDKDSKEVFVIKREIFHLLPEFTISFSNGEFATLKSRFAILHRAIDVVYPMMDISIEGDFLSREFVILNGVKPIGLMTRKLFAIGDYFEIEVIEEKHMDIIVALMIAMDYLIDAAEGSH